MKSKIVFCIFFILIFEFVLKAQNFEWLKSYGTKNKNESIQHIFAENNNNYEIFFDGSLGISDTLTFDKYKYITNKSNSEDYLVRFDSLSHSILAKCIGNVYTLCLCKDFNGNYYLGGTITKSNRTLDSNNLNLSDGKAFIAKFSNDFKLVWINQFGNDTTSVIRKLKFYNNHLYFIGFSTDSTKIGSTTYYFGGYPTSFYGEININNGNVKWSKYLYNNINNQTLLISDLVYLKNKLILSGNVVGQDIKINSDTFKDGSGFIVKSDTLGNYENRFLVKSKGTLINFILTDNNNLYFGGRFIDTVKFGSRKILPELNSGTPNAFELFVACVNYNLKPVWFFRPKILEKTSKNIGNQIICAEINAGYLYFGGYFNTKIMIDSLILSSNNLDILLFKSDTLGNVLWATQGNTYQGGIANIAKIGQSVIACGRFTDSIKFSSLKTFSKGGLDAFITKVTDFSITRGKVKQGPYCAGDTILIPYTKFGVFDTANTFFAQLSDEYGNFDNGYRQLGRLKTNKDSTIIGVLPNFKVSSSSLYRIRVVSNNPSVQSYYRYDTLRLLIYSRDKADPGLPDTICFGDTIKLSTYGGTKWTWSLKYKMNDSTIRQPLVNPDTSTIYRIVIADSSGCGKPDTAFKLIVVKPSPKAVLDITDSAVCSNDFIKIPVRFVGGDSANYSWEWFLVNSPKSYFALGSGKFKLSDTLKLITSVDNTYSQKFAVILSDNCSAKHDTAFVTISQRKPVKISSNLRDTTLCYGNQINYTAQATGGVAKYYQYQWKDLISNSILSDSASLKTSADNTLKVQLTVNDGCLALADTFVFNIKVKPKLELITNLKDTTVCQNRSLSFSAKAKGGDSSNYSFKWLLNNKEIGTGKNLIISTSTSTSTLTLTLTDHCSIPEDTIKAQITVLPAPQADFTTGITCSKTKTDFTFTGKKITNTTFEWNFDNESKAYSENASYMFSSAGNKTIKLITKADNNCNDTIEKTIEIKKQAK
ncbi:MAG: hypothetical protein IT243_06680, partial [Bacteroidia bacterium]|nr:hypothetical protein [Bacteroidia bacterium]